MKTCRLTEPRDQHRLLRQQGIERQLHTLRIEGAADLDLQKTQRIRAGRCLGQLFNQQLLLGRQGVTQVLLVHRYHVHAPVSSVFIARSRALRSNMSPMATTILRGPSNGSRA